jgi:hypothetical protein
MRDANNSLSWRLGGYGLFPKAKASYLRFRAIADCYDKRSVEGAYARFILLF